MQLPFTTDQFIHVFEIYNASIGVAPIVAYALAAGALAMMLAKARHANRAIALVLAGFWAFTGVAYHMHAFASINPAARFFGAAFVVQAALLAWSGLRGKLHFRYAGDLRSRLGVVLVAWAAVGYPLAGMLLGHGYPHGPVFGLTPCPLLLFTFGALLMTEHTPWYLAVIPMMWSVVGTSAAFALGIREDVTLLLSAVVFNVLRLREVRRARARVRSAALAR